MTITLDDPFATASDIAPVGEEKVWGRVYNGRYHLPRLDNPSVHQPRGWMRASNLVGAYSETRALNIWEQRQMLRGFYARPVLYEELMALGPNATDDQLSELLCQAKEAAGANDPARRGTARHTVLETRLATGELVGTPDMQAQQVMLEKTLSEHLLYPVPALAERIVVNDEVRCAGRFDVPLSCGQTGKLLMADLKTKPRPFWSLLELRAQLAIYAYATAMWCPVTARYVETPPFDLEEGVIIHMPVDGGPDGQPIVHLLNMDLRKGWETAKRARAVVDDRAEGKSAGTLSGCVRPRPTLGQTEAYALRLASVSTPAEGSALIAEIQARGMWCPELAEVARGMAKKLTSGP